VVTDEMGFYPEPTDRAWHVATKGYDLSVSLPLFSSVDKVLRFRITSQVEGPGHMDTGSGSGSSGSWSSPETREYVATFKRPELHMVEARVKYLQGALQDALQHYQTARKV
jgi:hypothetical protein